MAAPQQLAAVRAPSRARVVVSDYLTLTKPKVQSLLLLTTATTMYVAGDPSVSLVLATCLGGYLSAGGAGAVNHAYDRDIDAQMARTAPPPAPATPRCPPRPPGRSRPAGSPPEPRRSSGSCWPSPRSPSSRCS